VTSNITVLEQEPNDAGDQTRKLVPSSRARRPLEVGDIDWYTIRLIQGATVHIELWATRSIRRAGHGRHGAVLGLLPTTEDKLVEQGFRAGWTFERSTSTCALPTADDGPFFWIKVSPTGGLPEDHVLRELSPSVPAGAENEAANDVGGDDSTGTAQAVSPASSTASTATERRLLLRDRRRTVRAAIRGAGRVVWTVHR
jgi:hypothetical protein